MPKVYVCSHMVRGIAEETYIFPADAQAFTEDDFARYLGSRFEPRMGDVLHVQINEVLELPNRPAAVVSAARSEPSLAAASALLPPNTYVAYADGSCLGNPGAGGFGFVVLQGDAVVLEHHEAWPGVTTNQVMELAAAAAALNALASGSAVTLRTDSQYVIGIMRDDWKVKKNHEHVTQLRAAANRHRIVHYEHVRGHNGDRWNERADALARRGSVTAKAAA